MRGHRRLGPRIRQVNTAACRLFGYDDQELLGANVNVLMRRELGEVHQNLVQRYLQTAAQREMEGDISISAKLWVKFTSNVQYLASNRQATLLHCHPPLPPSGGWWGSDHGWFRE